MTLNILGIYWSYLMVKLFGETVESNPLVDE
jgi:hypothetical protein